MKRCTVIKYLIIAVFLMGCDTSVDSEMIKMANIICAGHGGIDFIHLPANDSVRCKDGLKAYLAGMEVKP